MSTTTERGFGTIGPPWWDDRAVFIVGGGQSLAGRDLSRLRECGRVLGINRAAEHVPCDATFTMDATFVREYAESLRTWAAQGQEVFAAMPADHLGTHPAIPGVTYLRRVEGVGLGDDPGAIVNGKHSGYGALCLAIWKRAPAIYLLGFDLKGKNRHWHDGYPWGSETRSAIYFERWARRFDEIAVSLAEMPGAPRVYNCNPDSAVTAFVPLSYEDVGL